MAKLDFGRALAGFGQGALSGYAQMMQMKMKEDYDMRMESVRAEREANLVRLRATLEEPYKKAELEQGWTRIGNEKSYQDAKLGLDKQQLEIAQTNASAAAAERTANASYRKEMLDRDIKEKTGAYDAERVKNQQKASDVFATNFEEINKGRLPQEEIDKQVGIIKGLGLTSGKQLFEVTNNKDSAATINNIKEKASEQMGKQILDWQNQGEDGQKQMIQAATVAGWDSKGGMSPDSFLRQKFVADSIRAFVPQQQQRQPETSTTSPREFDDRSIKLYADAIIASQSKNLTEEQANTFNTNVLPNYNKLTPEQKEEIKMEINRRKSRPGLLRGLSSDISDIFSGR